MTKMKTQLVSLALRPLTSLKPRNRNKTRWSSTFLMVERYNRFKQDDVFTKLCEDVPDMEAYMLAASEERRLQTLQKTLVDLHLVTKQLQDPLFTFAQMRVLFDCLMQEYPSLNLYVARDSEIIHSIPFESALTKISIGSVCVESFFSVVDSVFDSRRMSTLPIHVEEQMFLKCNRTLWIHKLG
jgi:hypothetical protein